MAITATTRSVTGAELDYRLLRCRVPCRVDGLTAAYVEEAVGVPGFLDDLRAAVKDDSLRPLPVRDRCSRWSARPCYPPQVGGLSSVRGLWAGSLAIADASYVLLVLFGGIVVMSHQTLQTSYAAKDIASRLVVGFLAANLSLVFSGRRSNWPTGCWPRWPGRG